MTQAKVDTRAEGEMPIEMPFEIEPFGVFIRIGIHVGSHEHGHDLLAPPHPNATKVHVFLHKARLGKLCRREEPKELLDGQIDAAPVLCQPIAEAWISRQL